MRTPYGAAVTHRRGRSNEEVLRMPLNIVSLCYLYKLSRSKTKVSVEVKVRVDAAKESAFLV